MFGSVLVPIVLAASALANLYITSPISTTTGSAGQAGNVSWIDDNTSPSLAQLGLVNIGLYAGNADQQSLLQMIATSVNASTVSAVPFTPNPSVGPDSSEYFIRVTSLTLKNGNYPEEAFSAKFSLTGMTGTFNSTVQAEINGQSTAPIGATPTNQPLATGSSAVASAAPTASSSSSSSSSGAGKPMAATGAMALVVALVSACFL